MRLVGILNSIKTYSLFLSSLAFLVTAADHPSILPYKLLHVSHPNACKNAHLPEACQTGSFQPRARIAAPRLLFLLKNSCSLCYFWVSP